MTYEIHPAADLFPMMSSERLAELAEDIRRNGQRMPIVLCDGKVLDGRNRLKACKLAAVEPEFEQFTGGNPFDFVWSINGARRDLDPGQRAAIRLRIFKASEEYNRQRDEAQREQRRIAGSATGPTKISREKSVGRTFYVYWSPKKMGVELDGGYVGCTTNPKRRAEEHGVDALEILLATSDRDEAVRCERDEKARRGLSTNGDNGSLIGSDHDAPEWSKSIRGHIPNETPQSHEILARSAGVSPSTAARVHALAGKRPDLLDAVAEGRIKLSEASRQVKRDTLADRVAALPAGKHRIIYADPPWKYGDSRDGLTESNYGKDRAYDETSAAGQYPTMSVADLCALDVRSLAADDAVLFCWATFPLLPDALQVVKAWGFTYKTSFVWDKQRSNLGHYHDARAELLLICTRGSATPEIDERPPQIQSIPRGKHSAKPELFRQLIDHMYPTGPRIELFRRGEVPRGWSAWGNEVSDSAA